MENDILHVLTMLFCLPYTSCIIPRYTSNFSTTFTVLNNIAHADSCVYVIETCACVTPLCFALYKLFVSFMYAYFCAEGICCFGRCLGALMESFMAFHNT